MQFAQEYATIKMGMMVQEKQSNGSIGLELNA